MSSDPRDVQGSLVIVCWLPQRCGEMVQVTSRLRELEFEMIEWRKTHDCFHQLKEVARTLIWLEQRRLSGSRVPR